MKKTININDILDERIRDYIKRYGMTYTTFVSLACERYLDSVTMSRQITDSFNETMLKMVSKMIPNEKDD